MQINSYETLFRDVVSVSRGQGLLGQASLEKAAGELLALSGTIGCQVAECLSADSKTSHGRVAFVRGENTSPDRDG